MQNHVVKEDHNQHRYAALTSTKMTLHHLRRAFLRTAPFTSLATEIQHPFVRGNLLTFAHTPKCEYCQHHELIKNFGQHSNLHSSRYSSLQYKGSITLICEVYDRLLFGSKKQ